MNHIRAGSAVRRTAVRRRIQAAAAAACLVLLATACEDTLPPDSSKSATPKAESKESTASAVASAEEKVTIKKAPKNIPANFRLPWQDYSLTGQSAAPIDGAAGTHMGTVSKRVKSEVLGQRFAFLSGCAENKKATALLTSGDLLDAQTVQRTPGPGTESMLPGQDGPEPLTADGGTGRTGTQDLFLFKDEKTARAYVEHLRKAARDCPLADMPGGPFKVLRAPNTDSAVDTTWSGRDLIIGTVSGTFDAGEGDASVLTASVHSSAVLLSSYQVGRAPVPWPAPAALGREAGKWVRYLREAPDPAGPLDRVDAWLCGWREWECARAYEPMGPFMPGTPGDKQEVWPREACLELYPARLAGTPSGGGQGTVDFITDWVKVSGDGSPLGLTVDIQFRIGKNPKRYIASTPVAGGCAEVFRMDLQASEYRLKSCPSAAMRGDAGCEISGWQRYSSTVTRDKNDRRQQPPAYYGVPYGYDPISGYDRLFKCPDSIKLNNCDDGFITGKEPPWGNLAGPKSVPGWIEGLAEHVLPRIPK